MMSDLITVSVVAELETRIHLVATFSDSESLEGPSVWK